MGLATEECKCGKVMEGLTGSNPVDNSLVRLEEVCSVVDELAALAVTGQHDLGVRALRACLFAVSATMPSHLVEHTTSTYSGG